MSDSMFTGYDIANIEQDKELLRASEESFSFNAGDVDPNVEVDPRPYLKMEMQGTMSSCCGHAGSSLMEMLWGLQAGSFAEVQQLSRYWCYRKSQEYWTGPNHNQDNGTTIDSVLRAMKAVGCPLESTVPYPRAYGPKLPNSSAVFAEASLRRIQSHAMAESWEQTTSWIRGIGGVDFGCIWTRAMANFRGLVWTESTVREDGSRSGHSFAGIGVVKHDGEDHIVGANSHSEAYGTRGFFLISRRAYEYLLGRRYSAIALVSDLTGVERKPRKLTTFSMG